MGLVGGEDRGSSGCSTSARSRASSAAVGGGSTTSPSARSRRRCCARSRATRACLQRLVGQAGRALGVATRADLADYHRLRLDDVAAGLDGSGLVPVDVDGWDTPAWADPAALETPVRGRHRTTLLSPFDSLIWDRKRTVRMFGFEHRIEAYVPRPKRVHGYYAMPLLAGGRLVGRVDPKRDGRTLHAMQVSLAAREVDRMAGALREAAEWVGCDSVALGAVEPRKAAAPLRAALEA